MEVKFIDLYVYHGNSTQREILESIVYIKEEEIFNIDNLNFHIRNVEEKSKLNPKKI